MEPGASEPLARARAQRRADGSREYFEVDGDGDLHMKPASDKWRPSLFMPRWASCLTLEITAVRVQRLQDISEEDAIAEGIARVPNGQWHWLNFDVTGQHGYHSARGAYDALWGDINGPQSWPSNPWVVALTFAVHKMNADALLAQRARETEAG